MIGYNKWFNNDCGLCESSRAYIHQEIYAFTSSQCEFRVAKQTYRVMWFFLLRQKNQHIMDCVKYGKIKRKKISIWIVSKLDLNNDCADF